MKVTKEHGSLNNYNITDACIDLYLYNKVDKKGFLPILLAKRI